MSMELAVAAVVAALGWTAVAVLLGIIVGRAVKNADDGRDRPGVPSADLGAGILPSVKVALRPSRNSSRRSTSR